MLIFHTQFLGILIVDTVTWANHIDPLISQLNSACYAIIAVKGMLSRKALRILHFTYVHSVIFCGVIVWANTANGIKIVRTKKQIK